MAKHGGAWKVAYADFITAMMALFMVLWILGTEQELLEQMQEYFRNPPTPWDRQSGKYLVDIGEFVGTMREGHHEDTFFNEMDPSLLKGIMEDFSRMVQSELSQSDAAPVEMVLTSDGLRMIIFDRENTPMFLEGSRELTEWGDFLVQNLAWLLSRYNFNVVIEGHSGPPASEEAGDDPDFGPWELSTGRANVVRRMLEKYAGGEVGISRVTGYGDKRPLEGGETRGRTHQRITLSLTLPNPLNGDPDVPAEPVEDR